MYIYITVNRLVALTSILLYRFHVAELADANLNKYNTNVLWN